MILILVLFGILWLFFGGVYGKSMLVIRFVNVFFKLYLINNIVKGFLIKICE